MLVARSLLSDPVITQISHWTHILQASPPNLPQPPAHAMTSLRDQLQATLGDGYVIQRELGGGGMSRTFVATDAGLGRSVVIKVLPEDLTGRVLLARFNREVSIAARLQHAHI